VFVLSIVVTIHELGHFWAARACGVAIDCFSIGFGRPWPRGATNPASSGGWPRFRWAATCGSRATRTPPACPTERPGRHEARDRRAEGEAAVGRYFHFKPIWQRAVIAAAGPIANFVLAIAIFTVLFAAYGEVTNPARSIAFFPAAPAAAAGFQAGDLIVKADSKRSDRSRTSSSTRPCAPTCRSTSPSSAAADAGTDRHPASGRAHRQDPAA
jgi:regulator of sigma E protease